VIALVDRGLATAVTKAVEHAFAAAGYDEPEAFVAVASAGAHAVG
jgi:galactokinase